MTNRTFAIIKPDAVKNNYTGKIYDHILDAGFSVLSAKIIKMTKCDAVKLEGGSNISGIVRYLVNKGINVMGHVGLLPQYASSYKIKG